MLFILICYSALNTLLEIALCMFFLFIISHFCVGECVLLSLVFSVSLNVSCYL